MEKNLKFYLKIKNGLKLKSLFDNYIGYIQNKNYIDKHYPNIKFIL